MKTSKARHPSRQQETQQPKSNLSNRTCKKKRRSKHKQSNKGCRDQKLKLRFEIQLVRRQKDGHSDKKKTHGKNNTQIIRKGRNKRSKRASKQAGRQASKREGERERERERDREKESKEARKNKNKNKKQNQRIRTRGGKPTSIYRRRAVMGHLYRVLDLNLGAILMSCGF